jgi:Methyltransferase domain
MARVQLDFDPYLGDPARSGFSLAQMTELILPCLDAVQARSVAEVGAYAGDLTKVLVAWAAGAGARVLAIDPAPQDGLVELDRDSPELELIRRTSLEALAEIPLPDAVIIDGDHNYYTVSHELAAIGARAEGAELPLLLFHDVCWPHGRRDDYFDPEQIPESDRHPIAGGRGGLYPGEPGLRPGALPYPSSAEREGGLRNGVLTAVEDFVAGRENLRLVVVPAFFGLGVVWHQGLAESDELARILDPWDRNPTLQRLEAGRVHHLAESHVRQSQIWKLQEQRSRQEALLRRMLQSSAFAIAERLSRLRVRARVAPAQTVIAKDEIRRVLGDQDRY